MTKRIIAIILAIVLIFGAVAMISGCSKDDDTSATPSESTDMNNSSEESTDEPVTEEKEDISGEETENKAENDTESEENKTEPTQTEKPTDADEPATCETCGKEILSDSYSGELTIGEYCDGKCDEWLGELEL